jgi:hypothetical protein
MPAKSGKKLKKKAAAAVGVVVVAPSTNHEEAIIETVVENANKSALEKAAIPKKRLDVTVIFGTENKDAAEGKFNSEA